MTLPRCLRPAWLTVFIACCWYCCCCLEKTQLRAHAFYSVTYSSTTTTRQKHTPNNNCRQRRQVVGSVGLSSQRRGCFHPSLILATASARKTTLCHQGWVQDSQGEWEWQEYDGQQFSPASTSASSSSSTVTTAEEPALVSSTLLNTATPRLPAGAFRPKQSLGQNYLKDPNTVRKILNAFARDHSAIPQLTRILELGPGAGALTNPLVERYCGDGVAASSSNSQKDHLLQCIEVDERSVQLLRERFPQLMVHHADVLQVNYAQMYQDNGCQPLVIIGNLPYYITSQILFALADASHVGAIYSATVTMQWEVAQRMVAPTHCKDYGILSVVFQLYADVQLHFKIPPTVFYPQPKVDSALVGLHFVPPPVLAQRLAGVRPAQLRSVVTTAFQQRRKTIRNSVKKLVLLLQQPQPQQHGNDTSTTTSTTTTTTGWDRYNVDDGPPPPLPHSVQLLKQQGDAFAQTQQLCQGWASKRPEELTPGQFIELTRLIYGSDHNDDDDDEYAPSSSSSSSAVAASANDMNKTPWMPLPTGKVWRKLKHGI